MAITISGENNNDRILAADGVIDQISGINIVGLITASHINVGSNIQLGNAGIITATTFVGNVTGNVNSTSPLLLQTGGSERFRITGNNELGIAGANYGSSGQVLTSGGSGSAVSWTTIPTQVTISSNANNRIITGGSGTNLVGEANLTWDGSVLSATGSDAQLRLYDSTASSENSAFRLMAYNGVNMIQSGKAFSSDSKADLVFGSMFGGSEFVRITSAGDMGVGTGDAWARLVVHETSSNTSLTGHNYLASQSGMSIENGSTTDGCFSAYTARVKNNAGTQQSGSLAFKSTSSGYTPEIHLTQRTGAGVQATRLLINSSGDILTTGNTQLFGSNTSDGSDNKAIMINGGGAVSDSRGGYLLVHGNEHSSNPGVTRIHAGNVSNAYIAFNTGGNERLRITSDGNVNVNSSGLSSPYSSFRHISINNNLILNAANSAGGFAGMQNNAYLNSSGQWVRVNNDHATSIGTDDGVFYFRNAPAGTGTITWNHCITILANGKIGISNNNPQHPLHIVNTSSTFNSASLIKGDTSTSGGGAYATFTNTADSKSAYFGVDGNGLFNVDAGAALVGTNGSEPIIFATNGNDIKVRIFGGSDNCLQLDGGSKLSITDYAPNLTFSGTYAGLHHDNHGNTLLALNAHLNYSGTSGTHQWKQSNGHPTIGSAGMFIGGNGSANNTNICFFRNSQGSSAGTVFAQDSWKFQIGSAIRQNFNLQYLQRGYFKNDTNQQNANNFPLAASSSIGGYAWGFQEAFSTSSGSWVHPYPDLVLGYHTGTRFGSHRNYGGCRFYQDHPSSNTSTVLEVGNGSTGVHVTNSFTAGSNKGFRIAHPHPSKKYTHDLVHNAIEAPQMDLIYRGKVDLVAGSATVNIDIKAGMTDGTFVLLNRDVQCFTSNETGWTAVKGSVSGNILTITAQDNSCTDTISWMVVGERQDDKIKESELTTEDGDLIVEPLTIEATHM